MGAGEIGEICMTDRNDAIRDHLIRVLDWEEAHVGFDKAVDGIAFAKRGVRPPGFEHSAWELLEHIRVAQDDILDFCVNDRYEHTMAWPADYWPKSPQPANETAWDASVAAYTRGKEQMKELVRRIEDLTAPVPTGKANQTYLRAVLLIADHTAYHVGQIVAVRRALGAWA
jgi:uncharacterized damage-inducible protein DinB